MSQNHEFDQNEIIVGSTLGTIVNEKHIYGGTAQKMMQKDGDLNHSLTLS